MAGDTWERGLVAVTAVHAGFQLTVSAVVYPALASVPDGQWSEVHAAHSRRITRVVGLVYLPLLAVLGGALRAHPTRSTVLTATTSLAALGLTAAVAGPLHRRLAVGRDPALVRRLLRADLGRTAFALVALAGAVTTAGAPARGV
jgi:hypothetical protein